MPSKLGDRDACREIGTEETLVAERRRNVAVSFQDEFLRWQLP
ncbi:MAG: hypothetical protein ABSH13_19645 [Candidatus Acidiferrum sp.]